MFIYNPWCLGPLNHGELTLLVDLTIICWSFQHLRGPVSIVLVCCMYFIYGNLCSVYTFGFCLLVPGNITGLLLPAPTSSHGENTEGGAEQEPPVPPPRPQGRSMSMDASKGI